MRLSHSLFLFVSISFLCSMMGCESASSIEDPNKFYFIKFFGGDGDQTFMFGDLTFRQTVDASTHSLQQAFGRHARQNHSVGTDGIEVAGTQHSFLPEQIQDALDVGIVAHYPAVCSFYSSTSSI